MRAVAALLPGEIISGGGVASVARAIFTTEELGELEHLADHLDRRPIKYRVTSDPRAAMRLSGPYISPPNTKRR